MPKVYVINKGSHDFHEALRFGELHFLSEGPVSKFAVSKIYREFAMALRESAPTDYILLTGLTTMSCIACACFSFLHRGKLNLLLFKNGRYVERNLSLAELLEKGEQKQLDEITK
jgi:hypothetical protein